MKQKKRWEVKRQLLALLLCFTMTMSSGIVYAEENEVPQDPEAGTEYVCGYEEHAHEDGCYTAELICQESTEPVLVCEKEVYAHTEACYAAAEVICEKEEHDHDEACYTVHVHVEECGNEESICQESTEPVLVCEKEVYAHTEACYAAAEVICEKEEHDHDGACYAVHVHEAECYGEPVLVCEKAVHEHTDACKEAEPVLMKSKALKLVGNDVATIGADGFETLKDAIDAAHAISAGEVDTVVIDLVKDVDFNESFKITRNITIRGNGKTMTRGSSYTGGLFSVSADVTLTLDDVIIDGNNDWIFLEEQYKAAVDSGNRVSNSSVCYTIYEENAPVATATLIGVSGRIVLDGSTIKNHVGSSLFYVGGTGSLIMDDAIIDHNTKNGSSVVADVDGYWEINGDTVISNNHNHGGNGTLSYMRGTTVMNNGKIFNNTGVDNNGSVMMIYGGKSSFTMNNGHIYDNGALEGSNNGWNCAFYVYGNGAKFTMNDGLIEGNYSSIIPGVANNGSNGLITLSGGKIQDSKSAKNYSYRDLYAYCQVNLSNDVVSDTNMFYGSVTNTGTLTGDSWFYKNTIKYDGGGTINGKVTVKGGAEMTMENGTWNGLVTVDAVGSDTTLTVKPDAVITGPQVRVLNYVPSGDSENAEEAAAEQAAAYVQEQGASVTCPVLYYHRLTNAQKNNIVVTYDYNGGLDAQGWSGIQRTSADASYTLEPLPTPTKEGYELTGWKYAVENAPESLNMEGADDYVAGTAVTKSVRLIAQWNQIEYVCETVETTQDGYKTIKQYTTLAQAIEEANQSEGADTIRMLKSIDFDTDYMAYYKSASKVDYHTITGDITVIGHDDIPGDETISRGAYTGTMFHVPADASLTLDGGLVIDGNNNWGFDSATYNDHLINKLKQGIYIYDVPDSEKPATKIYNSEKASQYFTLEEGATVAEAFMIRAGGVVHLKDVTVQNNYSKTSGVIDTLAGAVVNLEGAQIKHCASLEGNGVVVKSDNKATINIKENTLIDGNHVGGNHGLFKVYSGSVVNMSGGTIQNTTGWDSNGVVIGVYGSGSTFNMSGGLICNNSSVRGPANSRNPAVYLHDSSTGNFTGGVICHNVGNTLSGGIASYKTSSSLTINRSDQRFDDPDWKESGAAAYRAENHLYVVDNAALMFTKNDVGHEKETDKWGITGGIYTQDVNLYCLEGYVCIPYEDTERTDDYIVVPGWRVNYYSVEKTVTTDSETGVENVEYKTNLEKTDYVPMPRDKTWEDMDERAKQYKIENEEGASIGTWYTEQELLNVYDFENTKMTGDLDVFGEWGHQYGYIVIEKQLSTYNATNPSAVAVFEVLAKAGDEVVFNDVVALSQTGNGPASVKVGPFPEGAVVTVTEVYSGAGYALTGTESSTQTVVANDLWNDCDTYEEAKEKGFTGLDDADTAYVKFTFTGKHNNVPNGGNVSQ